MEVSVKSSWAHHHSPNLNLLKVKKRLHKNYLIERIASNPYVIITFFLRLPQQKINKQCNVNVHIKHSNRFISILVKCVFCIEGISASNLNYWEREILFSWQPCNPPYSFSSSSSFRWQMYQSSPLRSMMAQSTPILPGLSGLDASWLHPPLPASP